MERLFELDLQLFHDTILLAVSVFVLFTVLSYLLFEPARKLLEDRKEKISKNIAAAVSDKKEAARVKEEYKTRLRHVEKEAEEILSEARSKALKNEARILEKAREEASRIIRHAGEEASLEKKRVLDEMKQEMISIAALMAAKVVTASIDTTIQAALVEETLKEIGGSTWQSR